MKLLNFLHKKLNIKSVNFRGFTLAEVLITISIVGVVAAMTMPTLMLSTQNRINVSKFKKSMSNLKSAPKIATLEDESLSWDCTGDLELSNVKKGPCRQSILENSMTGYRIQDYDESVLSSTYGDIRDSVIRSQNIPNISAYSGRIYHLQDEAMLFTNFDDKNHACSLQSLVEDQENDITELFKYCGAYLDVNGLSGPNKMSKCTSGSNKTIGRSTNQSASLEMPSNLSVASDCIVKSSDIGDIYYILFIDKYVVPVDAASAYVLGN